MKIKHSIGLAAGIATVTAAGVLAAAAWAAPLQHGPSPAQTEPVTKSLQGNPANAAWKSDPYLQAIYHLSVGAFAKGAENVDLPSYQDAFFAIIRAKAVVSGVRPEGMVDHMKAIPRQMVDIVKDDPKTLDNYDNFVVALVGPR
jgi:hypothetical protein